MSGLEIAAAAISGIIGAAALAVAAYSAAMLFIRNLWSYNDRPWEDLHDDVHAAVASFQHSPPGQPYLGFQPGPVLRQRDYQLIGEAAEAAKKQDEADKAAERRDARRRITGQTRSRDASE